MRENFARIRDRSKHTVNNVQCQRSHTYLSSRHIYCSCGRSFVYKNPKTIIVEQIQRNMRRTLNCLRHLHSFSEEDQFEVESGVSRKIRKKRGKAHLAVHNSRRKGHASILDRWTRDDRYRESQLSIGWTEEEVKAWEL